MPGRDRWDATSSPPLAKWVDRQRRATFLQPFPIGEQLGLVQFSPRLDKPELAPGKRAGNQLNWIETDNSNVVLIVRVEVRQVVRHAGFHVHANDDPEKTAEVWHGVILAREEPSLMRSGISKDRFSNVPPKKLQLTGSPTPQLHDSGGVKISQQPLVSTRSACHSKNGVACCGTEWRS